MSASDKGIIAAMFKEVGRSSEEQRANAHLIAAAPEMLEQLKEMVQSCGCYGCSGESDTASVRWARDGADMEGLRSDDGIQLKVFQSDFPLTVLVAAIAQGRLPMGGAA